MKTKTRKTNRKNNAKNQGQSYSKTYDFITQRIIELIEQDLNPWTRGFYHDAGQWPTNAKTGKVYQGINVLMLSIVRAMKEFKSNLWMSYNQAKDAGLIVPAGEKSPIFVTFFTVIDRRTPQEKANTTDKTWRRNHPEEYTAIMKKVYSVLKYTPVWNVDQLEGPEEVKMKYYIPPTLKNHDPIKKAESIWENWTDKPTIKYEGNQPCYYPGSDTIEMPPLERYEQPERFYKTRFHESGHATGHESRIGRPGIMELNTTNKERYSFEELVAELTAVFLCSRAGIELEKIEENAGVYIKGWLEPLKKDPKMVVKASTQAQKATNYILGELDDPNAGSQE